jgi:hypothetical protein
LKKVIWQQDGGRKTPFSFLEQAATEGISRIENIDDEELGLGNLKIKGWK